MDYDRTEAVAVLRRTPAALDELLRGLPDPWLHASEGPDTWSPRDVVAHLCDAERELWLPRLRLILSGRPTEPFAPFDRVRFRTGYAGWAVDTLLDEFAALRRASLGQLDEIAPGPEALRMQGHHPEFGPVTASQLLATWTVHDLTHLGQILRTMARQYAEAVGPWRQYLRILR